jgi:deferrochelatase/peroxidase EfeB
MNGAPVPGVEDDRLQEGIYYQSGETPGPCYRLLLLNVNAGTESRATREALASLWQMLDELKGGIVRDLRPSRPGEPEVEGIGGHLTALLGYGAAFFSSTFHTPPLTSQPRPPALHRLARPPHRPDQPSPFPKLHWASGLTGNSGEADLALQLIGDTDLVVNRAIVEVRKLIRRERLPLALSTFFSGFQREDRRSWIDFHDGVNTMRPEERRTAMVIPPSLDHPWLVDGTYMAFLKIAVDLDAWQEQSREEQETLVGRDKLSGCPLARVDLNAQGELIPRVIAQCPMTGSFPEHPPVEFLNPPQPTGALARSGHIYRSNLNRGDPGQDANNRLYRQGYEFLDAIPLDVQAGLNFVSFQRDTRFVERILSIGAWLGDVNFGGPAVPQGGEPSPIELMSLLSGGFYAVPPRAEPFPGAELFED